MIRYFHNVTILGTSHIADESVKELRRLFSEEKPDVIAIELDSGRFDSLLARMNGVDVEKSYYSPRSIGLQAFLFVKLAAFLQNKLALRLGVKPGVEMEEAVRLSRNNDVPIVLIDKPIDATLRDFSGKIPLSEKLKLFFDPFLSLFQRHEKVTIDLTRIPDEKIIEKAMVVLKDRYPKLYDVLVGSRNHFMAKRIYDLHKNNKNVLVVVGAGHVEGILAYLKKFEKEDLSKPSFSFSFSIQ